MRKRITSKPPADSLPPRRDFGRLLLLDERPDFIGLAVSAAKAGSHKLSTIADFENPVSS